jgi:hypothetical protein
VAVTAKGTGFRRPIVFSLRAANATLSGTAYMMTVRMVAMVGNTRPRSRPLTPSAIAPA